MVMGVSWDSDSVPFRPKATLPSAHLRRAGTHDELGRGLLLVARFAERWGTRHVRQGKTAWAELSEKESAGFRAWDSPEE